MNKDRYYSDEELVAFLDGENDFTFADEISIALKTDMSLAKRMDALRIDSDEIANSFSDLLEGAPQAPAIPVDEQKVRIGSKMFAAGLFALMIGFGAGAILTRPSGDWKAYVAAYQALYTHNTLVDVQFDDGEKLAQLHKVGAAIDKKIELNKLNFSGEILYKRAQLLGFKGKALVQLAFLDSTGAPLALCIMRSGKSDDLSIRPNTLEGMSSVSWVKSGYEYLLIGGTNQSLLTRLAQDFSKSSL